MKKRLICLFICVVISLSILPVTAFAMTSISSVAINEVYSIATGTEPICSAVSQTAGVEVVKVRWYEKQNSTDAGTLMSAGQKFTPGKYYAVEVDVETMVDYYFTYYPEATINGKTATVKNSSSSNFTIRYDYPDMCLGTVKDFVINIAKPIAGENPDYTKVDGEGYESTNERNNGAAYKNGIWWVNVTDSEVLYPEGVSNPDLKVGKFEADKEYQVGIMVMAKTGYVFPSTGLTVTLNGNKVKSSDIERIDKWCIVVKASFVAHGHKPSGWKTDKDYHWKVCTGLGCGEILAEKTPHTFGDYVYNNDATEQADGTKTRTCSVCGEKETVTAEGTRLEKTLIDSSKMFKDVPANAWYKYYVDYAVAYGIFSGTSDTTFSPNADMTRAQFVQVLANISGVKLDNSVKTGFNDAPSGKWFSGAVEWAAKSGIASGVGGGNFNPTGKIDRQQMCTMLVNYVENYKKTTLKEKVEYKTFADDKAIAGWAKTSVIKCFKAGLVSGTGNNMFSPKVVANRATGATIFTNFHKEYIAN